MNTHKENIKLGLVGVGKIARTEHFPSIERLKGFGLVATASPNSSIEGLNSFSTNKDMLENCPDLEAVVMCQPSQFRTKAALRAISVGKHVLLEKPPASTLSEAQKIIQASEKSAGSVFMTWHSRFASSVPLLKSLLKGRHIERCDIVWEENVHKWHPGQNWIWQPGGFGVFDPGINAISIMTEILDFPVYVTRSELFFPENKKAPIAANLTFSGQTYPIVEARFDWCADGDNEKWEIDIYADDDHFRLFEGGAKLLHNGENISVKPTGTEYDGVYKRFLELIKSGESEMDIRPLRHVADAFMRAEIHRVDPYIVS